MREQKDTGRGTRQKRVRPSKDFRVNVENARMYTFKTPMSFMTRERFEHTNGNACSVQDTKKHADTHSHAQRTRNTHNTIQRVDLDNLFLHEAKNSPTSEGPNSTHSNP